MQERTNNKPCVGFQPRYVFGALQMTLLEIINSSVMSTQRLQQGSGIIISRGTDDSLLQVTLQRVINKEKCQILIRSTGGLPFITETNKSQTDAKRRPKTSRHPEDKMKTKTFICING